MRVLLVHDRLGSLGGAESTLRRLIHGLADADVELSLLFGTRTGRGELELEQRLTSAWSFQSEDGLRAALAWQPHVVFVHKLASLEVLEALCDSGRPLVRMVHDHDIYCQRRHRYMPWNRRICTRRAGVMCGVLCGVLRDEQGPLPLRLASPTRVLRELELHRSFSHLITVSDFLADELELNGIDRARMTTLWPAVRPAPDDFLAQYTEPLLVFAGQVVRGKGVDVLLESLAQVRTPGYRCAIIGDGSHLGACRKLADRLRLQDRVRFEGWVPQDELHRHYRSARVGVVPSVWPEPLGAVGIEMMRHGLPVVAFDVGGIGEWLRHGETGFRVPVFDRQGFATHLDALLSAPELARRMGENARAQADARCNRRPHIEVVLDILRDAASRSGIGTFRGPDSRKPTSSRPETLGPESTPPSRSEVA